MGLHSATWRVHASAVDDVGLLEQSLCWLVGDDCEVSVESGKSWHGSLQTTIEATTKRKKAALDALAKMGEDVLRGLLDDGVARRIDEEKVMHVRIRLSELVRGQVSVVSDDDLVATAKGQFKIESYPGSEPSEVISETIGTMLEGR